MIKKDQILTVFMLEHYMF